MEKLLSEIKDYILVNTVQEILKKNLLRFFNIIDENKFTLEELKDKFRNEEFNELRVDIEYFERNIDDIKNNFNKYLWVYDNLLEDEQSKKAYLYMMHAKVFMSSTDIEKAFTDEIIYFDKNVIGRLNNENYIDCGGYVGDTVLQFIKQCPNYSNVCVYEPLDNLISKCNDKLDYFIKEGSLILKKSAVYNEVKELHFSVQCGNGDSRVIDDGELIINASTLDTDIKEKITFIKMDIEGSEKNAIIGAKEHIKNYCPKMAICIYHLESDFWQIPKLIKSINENYIFKVRQHSQDSFSETVLYCLPKKNVENENNNVDEKVISKRCEEVLKNINLWSDDEKYNILAEMKVRKWYLSQLRSYKYDIQNKEKVICELRNWIGELEKSKDWLNNQWIAQKDVIENQSEYINKLLEDKSWIENQWVSEKMALENQKEYTNKLLQDKNWIENQWNLTNKALVEQKEYTNRILEDKDWIAKKYELLDKGYTNYIERCSNLEQEIELLKNNIKKVNYKFDRIKKDKLIWKIIKFRKYEI